MGTNKRYLIVNADDFGRSFGVNRGIIEAHENGIVTSASLMVRWPAAAAAAAYAKERPGLGLGLHLDLGEWAYKAGAWPAVYEVDRKSTRLNSSHANISYAVFCLKKKNKSLSVT